MKAPLLPILLSFLVQSAILVAPGLCSALTADQVVVVANKMAWHSSDLARYYVKKRGIPVENMIEVKAPVTEYCSREDYERYIATPIRSFLEKKDPQGIRYRCLVTVFGLPLRVGPPRLSPEDLIRLSDLRKRQDSIVDRIRQAEKRPDDGELKALRDVEIQIKGEINQVRKVSQDAAVDSELALVREESYPLDGWVPNKHFLGYRGQKIENMPQNVTLVSRLDGPSEEVVRRIVDDSLQTEKTGLHGVAYFDATMPYPNSQKVTGGAYYDRAIHNAARLLQQSKIMPVVFDSQKKLFEVGQCPDAALYCGWYSYAQYVDAFTWMRGAVGFHIASAECTTLKNRESRVWCKMMLERGVAATLGPVSEPYVQAFPPPDLFFALLIGGRLTLAECYALSNPYWSWQMVLIGDPLYRPFRVE